MREKIHCDLREIAGPDWADLTAEQTACLAQTVHAAEELYGTEPRLNGFVGTQRLDGTVGGFFVMQYEQEELYYDKRKRLRIRQRSAFARVFFVLFAETGKVLVQSRKFTGIPLSMVGALRLFRSAVDRVLTHCGISASTGLHLAPETNRPEDFLREFRRSTRVTRLAVTFPRAERIPGEFQYFSPPRERNSIIRDSHRHDYAHLKRVDLEAEPHGDLKETHISDLIFAGEPQIMRYYVGDDEYVMRRDAPRKFEFYLDMKAERLPEEQLTRVIELLRRERAVLLDTPTPRPAPDRQMRLFGPVKADK